MQIISSRFNNTTVEKLFKQIDMENQNDICAHFTSDSTGKITSIGDQVPCNPIGSNPNFILIGAITIGVLILWFLIGRPKWKVWASHKAGQADLTKAQNETQIQIAMADARLKAAQQNKSAAIIEAEAVSEQIKQIGADLKAHGLFLQWQWIEMMRSKPDGTVIYVPTEAGLPILEAGKRSKFGLGKEEEEE